jgi:hypothetical protein
MSPGGGSTPGLTDWLTRRQSQRDSDSDLPLFVPKMKWKLINVFILLATILNCLWPGAQDPFSLNIYLKNYNCLFVQELGHLLTRVVLSCPNISLKALLHFWIPFFCDFLICDLGSTGDEHASVGPLGCYAAWAYFGETYCFCLRQYVPSKLWYICTSARAFTNQKNFSLSLGCFPLGVYVSFVVNPSAFRFCSHAFYFSACNFCFAF